MRPYPEDLPEFGKEFEKVWQEYFEPAPDKPVIVAGLMAAYLHQSMGLCTFLIFWCHRYLGRDSVAESKKFMSQFYFTVSWVYPDTEYYRATLQGYPISFGFAHMGSGTDPYSPIDFHPGFLDECVTYLHPTPRKLTDCQICRHRRLKVGIQENARN